MSFLSRHRWSGPPYRGVQPAPSRSGESPSSAPTLLIADHQALLAATLAQFLSAASGFRVLGVCNSREHLDAALEAEPPDVLVLDLEMPELSVLSFLKRLRRRMPTVAVLVLSALPATVYGARLIEAGARGFQSKQAEPARLLQALEAVVAGQVWLHRDALDRARRGRGSPSESVDGTDRLSMLSTREVEVFRLLGQGKSPREVAALLHISPRTVASHRLRIYGKLGIQGLGELIRLAADLDKVHPRS
jgi:two-component system, NarL family, invasion response regulator UvrY